MGNHDVLHRAQNFLTNALHRYADQVRNHGSATRIDLNSILSPQQMEQLERLRAQGDTALQQADLNGDGVVDVHDLPLIVSRLDGVKMDQMPPGIQALMRAVDLNHDGKLNADDMVPIIEVLGRTAEGRAILDAIRKPDGTYDPAQVLADFTAIMQLGNDITVDSNGFVDLSSVPVEVREVLLRDLDKDNDGYLTPADLAEFLASLTVAKPNLPPGVAQASPPPSPLVPPPPIALPPVAPSSLLPSGADHAAATPDETAGGAGPVLATLLAIVLLGVLGFGGYRWWSKRSKPQATRRMIDVPVVVPPPSNYCPPLAGSAPLSVASDVGVPASGVPPV